MVTRSDALRILTIALTELNGRLAGNRAWRPRIEITIWELYAAALGLPLPEVLRRALALSRG